MEKQAQLSDSSMRWYHYLLVFFAGVFLTNGVPHFVNGISGNLFPTPFADPPGKGLSSPLTNVLWALFNFLVGYLFFSYGKLSSRNKLGLFIFFLGIAAINIMSSMAFVEKVK